VLLALGVVTVRLVVGQVIVHPRITGKVATVFQMLAVCWLLLRWDQGPQAQHLQIMKFWFLGAGIFTAISGLLYVWDGTQQLGSHPSSSPTQK
jgi:phosphatidylglycerophosphate synthase